MTESVQGWIDGIKARCLSCKLDQPRKPLPQYSLPRATKFNQVVTIDLKDYHDGKNICDMVDWHSRLTVGDLIENNEMIPSRS